MPFCMPFFAVKTDIPSALFADMLVIQVNAGVAVRTINYRGVVISH